MLYLVIGVRCNLRRLGNMRGGSKPQDPVERFWKKVKKSEGCWEWLAVVSSRGYGTFSLNYKSVSAHRYSYQLHFGEIPDGLLVCHTCDNPRCVNPDHLFLGTSLDNNHDMIKKGRSKPPKHLDKIKHPSFGAYKRGCRCDECKEIVAVKQRCRRSLNRDKENERLRTYRAKNKARLNAKQRENRLKNHSERLAYEREWKNKNRERINEQARIKAKLRDREKVNAYDRARRKRIKEQQHFKNS